MGGSQIGPPAIHSGPMRVAVVQAAPVLFDTPKSLQKCADFASDAAKQGAELVVFPEAFIGGYRSRCRRQVATLWPWPSGRRRRRT